MQPVLSFDTRKDVSCIAWSALQPDDVAVTFLYRSEVHVYDLSSIDGVSTSGGVGEADPKRVLDAAEGKGSNGHNVVMYWQNSASATSATASGQQKSTTSNGRHNNANVSSISECIVAGSCSGYIRCWGASSNSSRNFIWNVKADPLRHDLTAAPVVALCRLYAFQTHREGSADTSIASSSSSSASSCVKALLLAATAQGVITLWDLSLLRPAKFGSIQAEPACLRRVEYTYKLMLRGAITLLGVTAAANNIDDDASSGTPAEVDDSERHSTKSGSKPHVVRTLPDKVSLLAPLSTAGNGSNGVKSYSSAPPLPQTSFGRVLLTISNGDIHIADLDSQQVVSYSSTAAAATAGSSTSSSSSSTSTNANMNLSAGISTSTSTSTTFDYSIGRISEAERSVRLRTADPNQPIVLTYEQLQQQAQSRSNAAEDQGEFTIFYDLCASATQRKPEHLQIEN